MYDAPGFADDLPTPLRKAWNALVAGHFAAMGPNHPGTFLVAILHPSTATR
jgi:hypothetical protein